MPPKTIDVKRGRILLTAIEAIQRADGKFCCETTTHQSTKAVRLNGDIEVMVESDAERKKLMDDINKAIAPLVEPFLLRYHQEHRALVPSAIKKDL